MIQDSGARRDRAGAARAHLVFGQIGRGIESSLTVLAIFLMLAISAMVLGSWGLTYEATGGSVLEKLHPGTWIVFATFLLAMAGSGNPVRFLDRIIADNPGIFIFFVAFCVALFQLVVVQKVGFTPLSIPS